MKEVRKEFLKNLAFNHINTLHRQYKITDEKRQELIDKLNIGKKSFLKKLIGLFYYKKSFQEELLELFNNKENLFKEELIENAISRVGK